MKIYIEAPTKEYWEPKRNGVILVCSQSDKELLFKLLCEQDEDWRHYKNVIQVIDKTIFDGIDLYKAISYQYCGNTRIYDVAALREKVDFAIFQQDLNIE